MSDEKPFFPVQPEKLLEMNEVELQEYVASMARAFPDSGFIPPADRFFDALDEINHRRATRLLVRK